MFSSTFLSTELPLLQLSYIKSERKFDDKRIINVFPPIKTKIQRLNYMFSGLKNVHLDIYLFDEQAVECFIFWL